METITLKRRNQINTMLDLMKVFLEKGIHATLDSHKHSIDFTVYSDDYEEIKKMNNVIALFADKEDKSEITKARHSITGEPFYYISLIKKIERDV